MSFFSEEATLFAREFDIVEALRTTWSADMQRFFDELYAAVQQKLQGRVSSEKLVSRPTNGYRYWWVSSTSPRKERVVLWFSTTYPELIRDKQLHWFAYLEHDNGGDAPEARQKEWSQNALPELLKREPFQLSSGFDRRYRSVKLIIKMGEDPVADSATHLVEAFDLLSRALSMPESRG